MKKLLNLLTLLSFSTMAGMPPSTILNEQGSAGTGSTVTVVPNYQGSSLGGVKTRLETGNTNLLKDPSFEKPSLDPAWSITGATASIDNTNQVEGKQALSLALSGTLSVTQDSTINAANLVGLQGVASIKIKTSNVDGLKVCVRNAAVTSASLCINVPKDGTWKHISIPFIMTATSNGIALTSTGTSGTVYVDDAFVGTSAPFQDVSGAKLVGACTTTLGSDQSSTSATYATLSAASSISVVTYGQGQAPSTNTTGCKFASIPAGDYTIIWDGEFGNQTTGARSFFSVSDGTNQSTDEVGIIGSAGFGGNTMTARISYSTAQSNITFVPVAKIQTGISFIKANTKQTFKVYYFPPATKIYSQASQDYAYTNAGTITIGATTTAPTKGTAVTDRIMASRKGQNLLAKYQFEMSSIGTTGSGDYLFTLPSGLSFDTNIVIPSTAASDGRDAPTQKALVGYGHIGDGTNRGMCYLFAYDSTRFRAACGAVYGSYGFVSSGYYHLGTIRGFEFELNAPISGWSDYGVIVGSFAGLEKCANDYECTDTFSAQVSATGIVSNENIDWINGNCTNPSAANYTCTFLTNILKDGSSALVSPMNCTVTRDQATAAAGYTDPRVTSTTTGLTVFVPSPVSTNVNQPFSIRCQKGSSDYKPKNAKIADPTAVLFTNVVNTFTKQQNIAMYTYATGATIDFDNGNGITLSAPGGTAITMNNIVDGGTYSVLITDGTSRTYAFTANKKEGGALTVRCSPTLAATTASKHALFNFIRSGSNLYCSWVGDL